MSQLLNSLRTVVDTLDRITSDETTRRLPYADTRSRAGIHSIANAQSGGSTYAAGRSRPAAGDATTESTLSGEPLDPLALRASPDGQCVPADDD
ncbi:uncharacterized protein Nmlp_3003 [Natronomonas moolapensis 8.8.11]|uniref:Uncharacterized protein n=1 Tax=Natronomonas moolapensis (strain DSM 18674 / CECT 7526 / JCM 14361 / 8.8.11) TaxID=268739 RepID=M1Y3P3_NATM8|nr:hypothetical protein [Natronomonas moolapensis]CCQ37146.1 uncharacterized protein Nmlp_3003 [Natronomonas moolapensis 8.8.11]